MRRGPIRKEMQAARRFVRTAVSTDQAFAGMDKYRQARERLAEVKGHDVPQYSSEFHHGSRRGPEIEAEQ